MESLETIRNRVKDLLINEEDGLKVTNGDGEGIVLDSCGTFTDEFGGIKDTKEYNIEVRTIFPNLYAYTNIGYINLVDMVADEDDWYTIEDIVSDYAC